MNVWVKKYQPTELVNWIGNGEIKKKIADFIEAQEIPHLLFYGPPGTGKSSLAKMLVNKISCDHLYINASDENSIEVVRSKIKDFASTMSFQGLKIIILDEVDYFSRPAQAALRNMMEEYMEGTRFILTCNYYERIEPALVSRTQQFQIQPPSELEAAKYIGNILKQENVQFTGHDLKQFFQVFFPDLRKLIHEIQSSVSNGQLVVSAEKLVNFEFTQRVLDELISSNTVNKKISSIRQIFADSKVKDFSVLYTFLFDNVEKLSSNISEIILVINEGQYRDAIVLDKELNASATIAGILRYI